MQTVVAIERRSLLMKEILDEAAFRSSVLEDVEEKRCGRFQRERGPCVQGN